MCVLIHTLGTTYKWRGIFDVVISSLISVILFLMKERKNKLVCYERQLFIYILIYIGVQQTFFEYS